jgi:Rps23 Pro-64 3,4-dihydroxylase Tpa1-like proline 4-hydroxylase
MAAKESKFSQESKDTDSTISVESNHMNASYARHSLGINLDNNEWICIKLNDYKNQSSEYENQNLVKKIDYLNVKFDSSKEMISRIDRKESSCQTDITQDVCNFYS